MLLTVLTAANAAVSDGAISWFQLIVGLLGGLALFLIGMDRMTEALRVVVGDRAKRILENLTTNRFAGLLTGAGITAVIQSSSVTTVLVVGFISAGLMTFPQSIPVILGANIGTTVTAQIIAFNITTWALALVAGGFAVSVIASRESRKAQGVAVMGLGLVFFGMVVMSDAMSPLRSYEPFISAMETLDNVLIGALVGLVLTALIQSSSATTGIVIVLASQGLISPIAGIAVVLGANVGTSVTALLSAIGKPREAQRAAVAHLIFNVGGVVIWLPFVGWLTSIVVDIGGGTAREVANAHTIFNIANALLVLPFVAPFAALVTRLVPDRAADQLVAPKYIDSALLATPSIALATTRSEMMRMASRVRRMLIEILPAVLDGGIDALAEVEALDDEVDAFHSLIIEYLGRISLEKLSEPSGEELMDLFEATNALEAIGDIIEKNLVALGRERMVASIVVSPETRKVVTSYHRSIVDAFDLALVAVTEKDPEAAKEVSTMKDDMATVERAASAHEAVRLVADAPNRIATYRFETDLLSNLKRIFYFVRRIARVAAPSAEQASME